MEFRSKRSSGSIGFQKRYAISGRRGRIYVVRDDRIVSEDAADQRGRAELLTRGHMVQRVRVRAHYSAVKPGDIVIVSAPKYNVPFNVTKNRFIVASIKTVSDESAVYDIVEAYRYD